MTLFCDLDGTLIDSKRRHVALLHDLLLVYAPGFAPACDDSYVADKAEGCNTKTYLLRLGLGDELAEQVTGMWAKHIEDEKYLALDIAYPDAHGFLEHQKQLGRTVIYVSARQKADALLRTLDRCKLLRYADDVIVVSPVHAAQNKTEAIRDRVAPGDIFVGDTEADHRCAVALGLPCFMLDRGFRSKRYWEGQGVCSYAALQQVDLAIERWYGTNG